MKVSILHNMKNLSVLLALFSLILLPSCSTTPPKDPENLCEIFREKEDWYEAAKDMNAQWGTPIHVPMAMMYQESSFKHDAAPPMQYFLWIIPLGRASSAYGYSQAKTMTWSDYTKDTNNGWASRDNFADAIDFMGWFTAKTHKINGISKWDAYAQYLNYHEGWGGYKKGSYKAKPWLVKVSKIVDKRSLRYASQLRSCKAELDESGFFDWF